MRHRQRSEEDLIQSAAYLPKTLHDAISAIAKENGWSFSQAMSFVVKQGLVVIRSGPGTLIASGKDGSGPAEITAAHKQRKTK